MLLRVLNNEDPHQPKCFKYILNNLENIDIVDSKHTKQKYTYMFNEYHQTPSNTFRNLQKPSNTFKLIHTNVTHVQTPSTTFRYLQRPPNTLKHMQTPANTCKQLQTTVNCKYLQTPANTLKIPLNTFTLINTFKRLQTLENLHNFFRHL